MLLIAGERGGKIVFATFRDSGAVLLAAALIGALAVGRLPRTRRFLSVNPLVYLGTISYGTYMLHFVTIPVCNRFYNDFVAARIFDDTFWNESFILMTFHYPVTIAISVISYELIERAFLKRKTNYLVARHPGG